MLLANKYVTVTAGEGFNGTDILIYETFFSLEGSGLLLLENVLLSELVSNE